MVIFDNQNYGLWCNPTLKESNPIRCIRDWFFWNWIRRIRLSYADLRRSDLRLAAW